MNGLSSSESREHTDKQEGPPSGSPWTGDDQKRTMYLWRRLEESSCGAAGGEDEGRLSEVPRGRLPAGWTCSGRDGVGYPAEGTNCRKAKMCPGAGEGVGVGPGPCWRLLVNVFIQHTFLSTFVLRLSHQAKNVNSPGAT